MSSDGTLSIGALAGQAGLTVKTVRFYSDQGLLPEAGRSGGGHRRYGPEAPARLHTIRSLRSLGVPVPEIRRVLDGGEALDAVVDRRLAELGTRLAALRWREAALRALHESHPGQLAERLRLIGAVGSPPGTDALAHYWRRLLPPRLSARLRTAVVEAVVPQPPADPSPGQVLAFARLHALVADATDACLVSHRPVTAAHPDLLYDGLHEAYGLAAGALRGGRAGGLDQALDCYVAAHARAAGTRAGPAFRRALAARSAAAEHPAMSRYWELAGELTPEPTLGAVEHRLRAALAAEVAAH